MKELITLQFGDYSNFVGTHYWNFQEEYLNTLNEHGVGNPEIDLNLCYRFGESKTVLKSYKLNSKSSHNLNRDKKRIHQEF